MTRYVGIDPSTRTGFVALDADGNVLEAREIESTRPGDPARMFDLVRQVAAAVAPGDVIAIENFGFSRNDTAHLMGGIGWSIRLQLYNRRFAYCEVSPSALKKFTGAGGSAGKEQVAVEVYKRWKHQYKSNNVTDAYVLAQIARVLHGPQAVQLTKFQLEVINAIRNPPVKNRRSDKSKSRKGDYA